MARWASPGLSRQALTGAHRFEVPGLGAVAWQQVGSVALALGDPLCPPAAVGTVLHGFLDYAGERGLQPVMAPLSTAVANVCREQGLLVNVLGREADIDLPGFTLRGNRAKGLRQSYARGLREGFGFELLTPPFTALEVSQLRRVSDAWLNHRPGELRVGLGWFNPGAFGHQPVGVTRNRQGEVVSFVTMHGYDGAEVGFDLLRRDPMAPPGAVDVLLVGLLRHLKEAGYARANLGLVPLTESMWSHRVLRWLGRRLVQYDCRGLRQFKNKFNPRWRERHVAFTSTRSVAEMMVRGLTGLALL